MLRVSQSQIHPVKFKKFPRAMIRLLEQLDWQSFMAGSEIVITGADGEPYGVSSPHSDGRALDLRSRNFPNPAALAANLKKLGYFVMYGDPAHEDHIHVAIPKGWN